MKPSIDTKGYRFYRERETGDYLCIATDTLSYYLRYFGKREYEGRATCIASQVDSVCTTGLSADYLREKCRRVRADAVPHRWMVAMLGD